MSFAEVYEGIDNGTLWTILMRCVPDIDVSLFAGEKAAGELMIGALRDAARGMRGREENYGVEKNGVALLLAYVLEAIQNDYWTRPGS